MSLLPLFASLTGRNWHAENSNVNQHGADAIDEIEKGRVDTSSFSVRIGELLPEITRRSTARNPGNGDGDPIAENQAHTNSMCEVDAEYSSVKQQD